MKFDLKRYSKSNLINHDYLANLSLISVKNYFF